MDGSIDRLARELRKLGQAELEMEQLIQTLRTECRKLAEAGRFDDADAAWAMIEKTRRALNETQVMIRTIEARLYSLRRRQWPY
jgi:hypothetical protein